MIILDTNIVSELLRPTPEPKVEAWLAAQDGSQVYLTALSEAELRYGVARGTAPLQSSWTKRIPANRGRAPRL